MLKHKNKYKRIPSLGLIIGLFLIILPAVARADTIIKSGTVTVSSQVSGPPPSTPPTIDQPADGSQFTTSPIAITGSCQNNLTVKIFRAETNFIGSTICSSNNYTLSVALTQGTNSIVARQYDGLDQASPDSNTISVTLIQSNVTPNPVTPTGNSSGTSSTKASALLTISTDGVLRSAYVGDLVTYPLDIEGGTLPYAVSIDWGDGDVLVQPRSLIGGFSVGHIYQKAGNYQIKVRVTDAANQTSYLEFATIIIGKKTTPAIIAGQSNIHSLNLLWLVGIFSLMALLFFSFAGHARHKNTYVAR